jgi:hypothetical protein
MAQFDKFLACCILIIAVSHEIGYGKHGLQELFKGGRDEISKRSDSGRIIPDRTTLLYFRRDAPRKNPR